MSTDAKLVAALWGLCCLAVIALYGRTRWDDRRYRAQHKATPVHWGAVDPTDQAQVAAILADPDIPDPVKMLVRLAVHDAGACTCGDPYDQDGQLTDEDQAWLAAQDGA